MPSFFGGSSNCGGAAAPGIAPAVYFGWGIPQDRNTSVSLTAQNNGAGNVRTVDIKLATGGFWLGAALPVSLTDNLAFVATGWYLFPGDSNANSSENFLNQQLEQNILLGNNWGAKPNWWFVDGAFSYGWQGFSVLLGLRYDYYTVSITGPSNVDGLFDNQDQGDVISRGWIPFIGFQSAYTDTVQSIKVRMLGIPTIVGSSYVGLSFVGNNRFAYNDVAYTGGHFYEVFGEYTRKFFGSSQAGVFARWNTARATSSDTGSLINNPAQQDTYNFSLNRSSLTLGGLVTFDFNTPF
jgi:hypothetical protein